MSAVKSWCNFLMNEKLEIDTEHMDEEWIVTLLDLVNALAAIRPPNISMHKHKLASRELLCMTAMDLGIDLPAIKNKRGKMAMGRGLLDAWNLAYKKKYGSNVGTLSMMEAKRRDIKTRLCKEGYKMPYKGQGSKEG